MSGGFERPRAEASRQQVSGGGLCDDLQGHLGQSISQSMRAGLPGDDIVRVEFPEHTITGMKDGDGIAPCRMDEEDAGGPSWKLLAQVLMQLPENIHHQISGYRLGGFDKPVHQHLYDCPGVATVGCTVRGSVHHDAQELILAHAEPSMIAIVGRPRALLS